MIKKNMDGLSLTGLKKNPMLVPLFFCVGMGAIGATLYLLRLALRSPDVSWSPKKNPEPWNEYKEKSYKFVTLYNHNPKSPAPEY